MRYRAAAWWKAGNDHPAEDVPVGFEVKNRIDPQSPQRLSALVKETSSGRGTGMETRKMVLKECGTHYGLSAGPCRKCPVLDAEATLYAQTWVKFFQRLDKKLEARRAGRG